MRKLGLLLGLIALPLAGRSATTIDANHHNSYGANIGWMEWLADSPADGVVIGEFICGGWIYGANVGWISMCRKDAMNQDVGPVNHIQYQNTLVSGQNDYGINYTIDPSTPGVAYLRGFAYGANIGWVNFDSPTNPFPGSISAGMKPQLSLFTGKMHGYAWSANCGWISLDEFESAPGNPMVEHYVQTDHILMGVDTNGNGIADAWEYLYFGGLLAPGQQNTSPNGNGMTLLQDYQDGVDPTIPNSGLHITAYSTTSGGTSSNLTFTTTTGRLYMIDVNGDITLPLNWTDSGLGLFAPAAGPSTMKMVIQASATKNFFRVRTMRPLP